MTDAPTEPADRPESDPRYLVALQAQAVAGQSALIAAVARADSHVAKAQALTTALLDIETEEAILVNAARSALDADTTEAAALASEVFERFLMETLGWAPTTPEQCQQLLASQRERVTSLEAEARRLSRVTDTAQSNLALVRARRNALMHALTVATDPLMTAPAYREVLTEVAAGNPDQVASP